MKKILMGIYGIMLSGGMAYACLSEPQLYELTGDVSIQVSANTSIILKGVKTATQVTAVKTSNGEDFLGLKVTVGVEWREELRNVFQRMVNAPPYGRTAVFKKNWTKIELPFDEKQKFPLDLVLDVESDAKTYKVSMHYQGPTDILKGCSSSSN